MRAAEQGTPGQTFLLGARNAITNLELVYRICSILDELAPDATPYRSRIEFVDDRPGHDRRYAIDPSRAEDTLGWSPKVGFDQGLRDVVRWYIENEPWWRGIHGCRVRHRSVGGGQVTRKGVILAGGSGTRLEPPDTGREQADPARVRQADDLLPAHDPDAGRHQRDPDHLDPRETLRASRNFWETARNGDWPSATQFRSSPGESPSRS